jgi:uncharacterized 2Fe-2S/4Fe-4S cluster protein (DUF4445 family)
METAGVDFSQIDTLYISGGFATAIDVDNAVSVGLLPAKLKQRTRAVGNSCLLGTAKFAFNREPLPPFFSNAKYIDLSTSKTFNKLFIENMYF